MKFFLMGIYFLVSFSSFAELQYQIGTKLDKKLNLGVLKNNQTYTIYRSRRLGSQGLSKLRKILIDNNLPFPKTIISMNDEGYGDKGNYVTEEYELQGDYGFNLFHAFQDTDQRTYIDGQNPRIPKEDIDKKGKLRNISAISYFQLEIDAPTDQLDGGLESFYRVLDIILDEKNQPVLFHCHGGKHRTGMIAMALRYIAGDGLGLSQEKTIVEDVKAKNDIEIEYKGYATKVALFFSGPRKENLNFMRWLVTTPRFQSYVLKYREKM